MVSGGGHLAGVVNSNWYSQRLGSDAPVRMFSGPQWKFTCQLGMKEKENQTVSIYTKVKNERMNKWDKYYNFLKVHLLCHQMNL